VNGAGQTVGTVAKKARGPALVGGLTAAGLAGGVALGSRFMGGRSPLHFRNGSSPVTPVARGAGKGLRKAGKGIGKAGKGIGKAGKGIGKAGEEIGKTGLTIGVGDVTMDLRRGRKESREGRKQSPVEVLLSGLTSRRAPG
jgi:hypothetical protein